jgi:hypothetical protein
MHTIPLRHVHEFIVAVETQYVLDICVCARVLVTGCMGMYMHLRACSLAYPACNVYAPYCDVVALQAPPRFSALSHNGVIFGKKF